MSILKTIPITLDLKRVGAIAISLKLASTYDDVVFLPLRPALEHSSVLVWKKNQPHTKTIETFIEFAKEQLSN